MKTDIFTSLHSCRQNIGTLSGIFTNSFGNAGCMSHLDSWWIFLSLRIVSNCSIIYAIWWSMWLKHDIVALPDKQLNVALESFISSSSFPIFRGGVSFQIKAKWFISDKYNAFLGECEILPWKRFPILSSYEVRGHVLSNTFLFFSVISASYLACWLV